MTTPLVLTYLTENIEIVVSCDVSRRFIVFSQFQHFGKLGPVCYESRRFRDTESNCSVSEIVLLSVVYTVNYFRPFLCERRFTIFSDHACLQYYKSVKALNSRLNRLA